MKRKGEMRSGEGGKTDPAIIDECEWVVVEVEVWRE
jgi:hypothetical protein